MTRRGLCAWVGILVTAGCVGEAAPPGADDLGVSDEALGAAAPALPPHVADAIRRRVHGRVFAIDHYVPVGPGRRVHVREHFTLRSWLAHPRRAALLLPGTVVTGSFYDLDVDGYRFAEDLAREGFFVFSVDYEGSGESTYPADGFTVTHDYLVDAMRTVVRYVRLARLVSAVDAIGESNGGAIAAELCADAARVRSCVLSSMLYRQGTPFFEAVFLDPGFLWFLMSQPDGYLDVTPELYFNILARTSPEVAAAVLATQPGLYAVPPLYAPVTLPWFDPTRARVPALVIQGTEDNIATQADADVLAAEYGSAPGAGGTATVLRIEGAGHLPRIEPGANAIWNAAVIDFLTATE